MTYWQVPKFKLKLGKLSKFMIRRTRTILFISLVVLFFITAPIVVFYSLGWRIDWTSKKIIQPGIFYFKVQPNSVQIYLNGKLKKKSDFFFGSTLIKNLKPEKYNVEIKKEGFYSWQKTLEIKPRQATEAKNIVLIRENPVFSSLSRETEEIFFSPDEKKAILKEKAESGQVGSKWTLKLIDLEKNIKSYLIEENNILADQNIANGKKQAYLVNLTFSPDSKRVLLEIKMEEKKEYYILEIEKSPSVLTFLSFSNSAVGEIEKIEFNPKNSQKLLLSLAYTDKISGKEIKISEADLTSRQIPSPVLEKVASYFIFKDIIYYLDKDGFLSKTDFSFSQREKLNLYPFPFKQNADYKIFASLNDIFLKENDILYIFNKEKRNFEKISEQVADLKFSSDFKKIVYYNNYEIWILFLEKEYGQPLKEKGEKLFLTRFSSEISDIFWYTNHYLIFKVESRIKIIEIDERDKINVIDLAESGNLLSDQITIKIPLNENIKIFWNRQNKKLYVLSDKILYVSEKLVP